MRQLRFLISIWLVFAFLGNLCVVPRAQAEIVLPTPGQMVALSKPFNPSVMRGIKVFANKPLSFDFIVDQGNFDTSRPLLIKLVKYFLSGLTVPQGDLWVNLSPYEKHRIVPNAFGQTEMGRDLLAQDYILKQVTASLIYPDSPTGKAFWAKVYAQAQKQFGTTQVPVNTFNKVWIVPNKAEVYEGPIKNGQATAYVTQATMKVMLEEDYLALEKNTPAVSLRKQSAGASQVVREIILPELEKEVNQGANFAQLRQIYNSLILAAWYKKKIKQSLLAKQYNDQNKVSGLNAYRLTLNANEIYRQYLQAFKKGAYNLIREERDPLTGQSIPRKYFSGGAKMGITDLAVTAIQPADSSKAQIVHVDMAMATDLKQKSADLTMPEDFYLLKFDSKAELNNVQNLSSLLTANYTVDSAKAQQLAQDIVLPDNQYSTDENGFTYLKTKEGRKLVEISKLGTIRFFNHEEKWILSIDGFGNKSYELQWDNGSHNVVMVRFSLSGERYQFNVQERKVYIYENRSWVHFSTWTGELKVSSNRYSPGSVFHLKEEYKKNRYKGSGVAFLNILSTLVKDHGSIFNITDQFGALREVAGRDGTALPLEIISQRQNDMNVIYFVSSINSQIRRVILNGVHFFPKVEKIFTHFKPFEDGLYMDKTQEVYPFIFIRNRVGYARMDRSGHVDMAMTIDKEKYATWVLQYNVAEDAKSMRVELAKRILNFQNTNKVYHLDDMTYLMTETGDKLAEISANQEVRFFNQLGRWIMTFDSKGEMTYELLWQGNALTQVRLRGANGQWVRIKTVKNPYGGESQGSAIYGENPDGTYMQNMLALFAVPLNALGYVDHLPNVLATNGTDDYSAIIHSLIDFLARDNAMSVPKSNPTGGIDLKRLDKQISVQGSNFTFTPPSLQTIRINGLMPMITGVEELTSLSGFFGTN